MKESNYLVKAKEQIEAVNKRMENGEGKTDGGLVSIAMKEDLTFLQVKNYINSF